MNADNTRVVVAVDGTSRSDGALKYAAEEARADGLSLRRSLGIVHVSPDYVPMTPLLPYLPADVEAEGRAILGEAEERVHAIAPELDVVPELRKGSRAGGILDAAAGADLLVVGHETRGGIEKVVALLRPAPGQAVAATSAAVTAWRARLEGVLRGR
jgi:nucleotide-binding universal stress UspA family protein